ncbi:MAG: PspC domain-containing protein [Firmicutes bacterium]|nr:PspC domain-containing protein [Bacillota bacterium]MBR7148379.1 PspC domain-containing protein [Bacillota bacterium]
MTRKLYRSTNDRAILGICGGIGEYLDIDPIIIRLIVVILTLLGFSGLLFYIVAIFVIPESPEYRAMKDGNYQQSTSYEYTYSGSGEATQSGEGTAPHYDYEVGPDGEVKQAPKKDLSDYGRERKRGGNGALILGLCLIAGGAFILLEMFLPWIDTRLILAVALIVIGLAVILKKR